MAFGFNNTANQNINRTADIYDYNSPYTYSFWFRSPGFATNDHIFAISDGTSNNRDFLKTDGTTANKLNLQASNGGGNTAVVGTTLLSVDTWYHIVITRTAANSLLLYLNGVLEITNSRNIAARAAAPIDIFIGADHGNTNPLNGWISSQKIWTSALSIAQFVNESRTVRPGLTTNLYGWWPTLINTQRNVDYSGHGRDWTEGGVIVNQPNPPISWVIIRQPPSFATPPVIVETDTLHAEGRAALQTADVRVEVAPTTDRSVLLKADNRAASESADVRTKVNS